MTETLGIQDGLALGGWKLAQATKGANNIAMLVGRKIVQLLHGIAELGALWRGEVLHPFILIEQAIPLIGRHGVEPHKQVAKMLLCLRREIAESGQILEVSLLLIEGQVAMASHPLI
jgi:hypothetical protein